MKMARLLFPILIVMFVLSLAVGVGRAYAQDAPIGGDLGGAINDLNKRCNLVYLLGEQLVSCASNEVKDTLTANGKDPSKLDPHKCYNITLVGDATEKDCTQAPFNFDWHYVTCPDGTEIAVDQGKSDDQACLEEAVARQQEQNNVTNSNINNPERQTCSTPDECLQNNALIDFLKKAINVLSGVVGLVVTAMIVMGGIQYSSAGGNPNATAAAKKRIFNALLALVAYLFLFVILEWLLPGGLF